MPRFNKYEHQWLRVIFDKNRRKFGKNRLNRTGFIDSGASNKKPRFEPKYRHFRAEINSKDFRYPGRLLVRD
jgi:hypothetical protein